MTIITESELREFWKNGISELPIFPKNTRFSLSAQDFIKSHKLEIRYESDKNITPEKFIEPQNYNSPTWDKPGGFPVVLTGPIPTCLECGQPIHSKPEHMTQLDSQHFASKTNPRIIFRGRVDSLHADVMLAASIARRFELLELGTHLDTLAAYCREILSAEYHMRPVASLTLMGLTDENLHQISHWPDKYLGIDHIVPSAKDHEVLHWLNMLRTHSRELEIFALQIFQPQGNVQIDIFNSLIRALNRLSSAVYVLELYFKAGKISWKVTE